MRPVALAQEGFILSVQLANQALLYQETRVSGAVILPSTSINQLIYASFVTRPA